MRGNLAGVSSVGAEAWVSYFPNDFILLCFTSYLLTSNAFPFLIDFILLSTHSLITLCT